MFDQIDGLPVHALVLHAAVIFVPLLAVAAIVYALVARWRPKIGWAVLLLALAAPVSTFVSVQSGHALRDRLLGQGMSGPIVQAIDDHMGYGQLTLYFTLALGVVSAVMVLVTLRRPGGLPKVADWGLAAVMIVLAGLAGYYVFQTGDTGARAVWGY